MHWSFHCDIRQCVVVYILYTVRPFPRGTDVVIVTSLGLADDKVGLSEMLPQDYLVVYDPSMCMKIDNPDPKDTKGDRSRVWWLVCVACKTYSNGFRTGFKQAMTMLPDITRSSISVIIYQCCWIIYSQFSCFNYCRSSLLSCVDIVSHVLFLLPLKVVFVAVVNSLWTPTSS